LASGYTIDKPIVTDIYEINSRERYKP
jgi:hypothetical protein